MVETGLGSFIDSLLDLRTVRAGIVMVPGVRGSGVRPPVGFAFVWAAPSIAAGDGPWRTAAPAAA